MNLIKRVSKAATSAALLAVAVAVCAGCGNKDDSAAQNAGSAAPASLGGPAVTPDVKAKIQTQEQSDAASRAASFAAQAGKPMPPPVKK